MPAIRKHPGPFLTADSTRIMLIGSQRFISTPMQSMQLDIPVAADP